MRLREHSLAALAALVLAPLALLCLAVRRGWREGIGERLGNWPGPAAGVIWIHGASVGEAVAATRLADALLAQGVRVFLSTNTLTGRAVLRNSRPELQSALAPLDHPWCVERVLATTKPAGLVLVETEIWPSRIAAAARHGIPVVIVSGRISDRSFPRYCRIRKLLRPTLGKIEAVGARSELDAERFLALGVARERIEVTGDLKLEPSAELPRLAEELAQLFDGLAQRNLALFVGGSTHAGEEDILLDVLRQIEQCDMRAVLVLAPRHPERFDEVEQALRTAGRDPIRRTQLAVDVGAKGEAIERLAQGGVLLLDSVGELPGVYARAAIAFVGGSLVPRGGHNVLEPVFVGTPVLFGPHVASAREAANLVCSIGAGKEVADAQALAEEVLAALADPSGTKQRGGSGRQQLEAHRGSAVRSAQLVQRVLAKLVSTVDRNGEASPRQRQ